MLARLETLDGVVHPQVDHRGELLQLRLAGPSALAAVFAALQGLGYTAEHATEPAPPDTRWYGSARVGELSREEAGVIARRVVPPFATAHGLSSALADRLRDAVAAALYRCFTAHTLGARAPMGALRTECSVAVEAAARPLVGPDAAREFVSTLWQAEAAREFGEDHGG